MSQRPTPVDDALHQYVITHGTREDDLLRRLRDETRSTGEAQMQIAPEQGALLAMLTRLLGARRCVEVGTFTGYSSLCIARALPADGALVCCDVSPEWTAIAQRYWREAGVDGRIDLRIAPALDTLASLRRDGQDATFDMAFLDADKEHYPEYYEQLLALLRPGGLLAVDNVLWHGDVVDTADQRPSTAAIRRLNRQIADDDRVELAMVTVGDGLTLARKR